MGRSIKNIPDKVVTALKGYDWPGNIRELENRIERALITTQGDTLEFGDWLPALGNVSGDGQSSTQLQKLEDVEREYIRSILNKTAWKVSGEKGAAKILGLNPNTLVSRMKKLGLERL
jgi:DNA-binding NtrC family response regulator